MVFIMELTACQFTSQQPQTETLQSPASTHGAVYWSDRTLVLLIDQLLASQLFTDTHPGPVLSLLKRLCFSASTLWTSSIASSNHLLSKCFSLKWSRCGHVDIRVYLIPQEFSFLFVSLVWHGETVSSRKQQITSISRKHLETLSWF